VDQRFLSARFPRSSKYHPDWIAASASGGASSLWLTEWLTEALDFRPGMRVLDLGCGRAASSIFLRREFGVEVWATDLWFSPSENRQRIEGAGLASGVFPIHADARSLPYADEFFDALVTIDSFHYYGTDDQYLSYLARFLKPGGTLGIALAGITKEMDGPVPDHVRAWWNQDQAWSFHSAAWWRRHWEQTGIVQVDVADSMPDGWRHWIAWHREIAPGNRLEIETLEADQGQWLTYVRVVGRRLAGVWLPDPALSIPAQYTPAPQLRDS
jgi:ubiquinone/menaquinone biosynthesis C-methylase UbiE